ncbi:MAG: hypothetical protein V1806_04235 [Pseudomonadota bacterium]
MPLLLPLSIVGYALLLHAAWRRQAELCLLSAISGVMGLLYLASLAGFLLPGAVLSFYGGLVCLAWGLFLGWHHHDHWRGLVEFCTPGLTLFLLACLGYHLIFPDVTMQLWDEFSHWGVMTKELLVTNQLPGPHGAVMFKDYPPGVNLLHYWVAVNSTPSEAAYYLGHFMLLAAPLAAFFSPLTWRRPGWIAGSILMTSAILVTLSVFVCSLMVDVVLGLYLAAGMFLAARSDLGKREVFLLVPVLFALPLIKSTGTLFAWMVVSLLLLNSLIAGLARWRRQRQGAAPAPETGPADPPLVTLVELEVHIQETAPPPPPPNHPWLTTLALVLILAAPLAASQSWKQHVAGLEVAASFPTQKIDLHSARQAFSPEASDKQKLIRQRFGQALFDLSLSNYLIERERSLVVWLKENLRLPVDELVPGLGLVPWLGLVGLLILAGFLRHRQGAARWRMARAWVLMLTFGAFYLVGLALLYMFSFSEFEGPRLASFGRYVNTLLIPMTMMAWGFALPGHDDPPKDQRLGGWRRLVFMACLAVFTITLASQAPSWPGMPKWLAKGDASQDRAVITPMAEVVKKAVPTDKKVFVIWQNSSGRNFHIIRYEIAPRPTNKWFFSLGKPYFEGDVWTEPLTLESWAQMLTDEKFDFVFLARADRQFWQRFGGLFSPGTRPEMDLVFKVVSDPEHGVILVPAGSLTIPGLPSALNGGDAYPG